MAIFGKKLFKKRENALLEQNSKQVFPLFLLFALLPVYKIVSLWINNNKEEKRLTSYKKVVQKLIIYIILT